jgi:hypothetical protein
VLSPTYLPTTRRLEMAIEVTIHSTGEGMCSYSGKECDGMTVTFADGTLTESFISTQTFVKFLRMKFNAAKKTSPRIGAKATANGTPGAEAAK